MLRSRSSRYLGYFALVMAPRPEVDPRAFVAVVVADFALAARPIPAFVPPAFARFLVAVARVVVVFWPVDPALRGMFTR